MSHFKGFLACLVGTTALGICGCSPTSHVGEFSQSLGARLAQSPVAQEIDLSEVIAMPWDELFIFGPYSDPKENCRSLQLNWLQCLIEYPSDVSEGEFILAFRRKGAATRVERHARSNGDFYSQQALRPQPIQRSAARFAVIPTSELTPGGRQWFRLEYKDKIAALEE